MKTMRALTILAVAALAVAAPEPWGFAQAAGRLVAVLDLNNTAGVTDSEARLLTDMVRTVASEALPAAKFRILTRENIEMLLPPGTNLQKCAEAKCEVEVGQKLGAEYIVTGDILIYNGKLRIELKAHHVPSKAYLGGKITPQGDKDQQEGFLKDAAGDIMRLVLNHAGVPSAATPPPASPAPVAHGAAPAAPAAAADPEFEKLVQQEQAKAEAQRRLDEKNKAKLEADYAKVKALRDNVDLPDSVKKAAYRKFVQKWSSDTTRTPEVQSWLDPRAAAAAAAAPAVAPPPAPRYGGTMVRVAPGKFLMGSPEGEPGRDPDETQHWVTISRPFLLGATEVTQGQWRKVMGNNPAFFTGCGDDCPVEQVSWYEAVDFCNRLSEVEGLPRCYSGAGNAIHWDQSCTGYRLPTEAEWEYAARAGTATAIYTGELTIVSDHNAPELDAIAWYSGNSGVDYPDGEDCSAVKDKQVAAATCGTHLVARKRGNDWGLYDMIGNVWEWVWDWKGSYPAGDVTDPTGPASGGNRVVRGGSWGRGAKGCRAAYRFDYDPGDEYDFVGFRLARSAP